MRRSGAPSQKRTPDISSGFQAPIKTKTAPDPGDQSGQVLAGQDQDCRHFVAIWCKQSGRKHKKWEDDAVLTVRPKDRYLIK